MSGFLNEMDTKKWEIQSFSGDGLSVLEVMMRFYSMNEGEKAQFLNVLKTKYADSAKIYQRSESHKTKNYLVSGFLDDHDTMFSPLGSTSSFLMWKYVYKQIIHNTRRGGV
jgi:hypothetical protein